MAMTNTLDKAPCQPHINRLVVKRLGYRDRTAGGIILLDYDDMGAGMQPARECPVAVVLAVGKMIRQVKEKPTEAKPKGRVRREVEYKAEVKRGNVVLFSRYAGNDIPELGDGVFCPRISEVLCVLSELGEDFAVNVTGNGFAIRDALN